VATTIVRVLDSAGNWRPSGTIMPLAPDPGDPRGLTTPFHGRYRGPHNTGVPNRSQLKIPRFGGIFDVPDQTYNDEYFMGFVEVRATGITFNRCYFEVQDALYGVNSTVQTTLIDCDIDGGTSKSVAVVAYGSVHYIRCHIFGGGQDSAGFGDGAQYDDCYIHGNIPHVGTHSDSVQMLSGDNLAVRRCKLLAYEVKTGDTNGFNSVMQISPIGPMNGLEIHDNYVDGGGFAFNGRPAMPNVSGIDIRGNRWGHHAQFGPIVTEDRVAPPYGTYDTATNVFDTTGVPV